jgi:hypothetical protein
LIGLPPLSISAGILFIKSLTKKKDHISFREGVSSL